MEIPNWILFGLSVLTIATTSIGIQAIGYTTKGDNTKYNKLFLVVILMLSLLAFLITGYLTYLEFKR
jgi:uncharacterized membrane protein